MLARIEYFAIAAFSLLIILAQDVNADKNHKQLGRLDLNTHFLSSIETSHPAIKSIKINATKSRAPEAILAKKLADKAISELAALFDPQPHLKVAINLLERMDFLAVTGAPAWTNALFLNGEVYIPLDKESISHDLLSQAIRHELLHLYLGHISGGKIPGWLDEGLAMHFEQNKELHILISLYKEWTRSNSPFRAVKLRTGFTKFIPEEVPLAYAQSLISSQLLLQKYGFNKLKEYLKNLAEGYGPDDAFYKTFQISEDDFFNETQTRIGY
ncbi:MAG TPA: peptidase MA family metallohydrolase [Oligoflexia bacterium]|nr:peptidase MA family metallohydrolase [Oligoflexia bacterium]HMP27812.1 peptidase MA family metallohydrolase [Oligoflexia bacterium]